MKVLSFTLVYPNPREPGLGLFVQARLQELGRLTELKVVAPVATIDYSNPNRKYFRRRDVPLTGTNEQVEVLYPRWIYPPGGTPVNVICLAARLFGLFLRVRKTFPFELLDVHFGYPEGVAGALLAWAFGVPFVVTLRGSEPVFAGYRRRRLCLQWALRRADAVIAVSEDLRRFAIELGTPAERASTITNGVDTNVFFPRDREACRARLGLPAAMRLIVCAGELIEAKGHHLAIQAVADLVSGGLDVSLVIAGGVARGGPRYDAHLRSMIARLGMEKRIRLAGAVGRDELAELLTAADVFTLPSYREGCPNVINEALACGTPVVATAVGAVPQLIPSEDYGFIVEPGRQEPLTAALARAINKPWDRTAISVWGSRRSWKAVAQELMDVLRPVLDVRQHNALQSESLVQPAPVEKN
jgi:teichuronic acid biosynthesis glycosyltransferase TuaC